MATRWPEAEKAKRQVLHLGEVRTSARSGDVDAPPRRGPGGAPSDPEPRVEARPEKRGWEEAEEEIKVEFDDRQAIVRDKQGVQICVFERKPGGGLYVCKFRLKSPGPGFARQG